MLQTSRSSNSILSILVSTLITIMSFQHASAKGNLCQVVFALNSGGLTQNVKENKTTDKTSLEIEKLLRQKNLEEYKSAFAKAYEEFFANSNYLSFVANIRATLKFNTGWNYTEISNFMKSIRSIEIQKDTKEKENQVNKMLSAFMIHSKLLDGEKSLVLSNRMINRAQLVLNRKILSYLYLFPEKHVYYLKNTYNETVPYRRADIITELVETMELALNKYNTYTKIKHKDLGRYKDHKLKLLIALATYTNKLKDFKKSNEFIAQLKAHSWNQEFNHSINFSLTQLLLNQLYFRVNNAESRRYVQEKDFIQIEELVSELYYKTVMNEDIVVDTKTKIKYTRLLSNIYKLKIKVSGERVSEDDVKIKNAAAKVLEELDYHVVE